MLEIDEDNNTAAEVHEGPVEAVFTIAARFPPSDIPLLIERMKR